MKVTLSEEKPKPLLTIDQIKPGKVFQLSDQDPDEGTMLKDDNGGATDMNGSYYHDADWGRDDRFYLVDAELVVRS